MRMSVKEVVFVVIVIRLNLSFVSNFMHFKRRLINSLELAVRKITFKELLSSVDQLMIFKHLLVNKTGAAMIPITNVLTNVLVFLNVI